MRAGFRGKDKDQKLVEQIFLFPALLVRHLVLAGSSFTSVSTYMLCICVCLYILCEMEREAGIFAEQCLNLSFGTAGIRGVCLINALFPPLLLFPSLTLILYLFFSLACFLLVLPALKYSNYSELCFRQCHFQVIAFSVVQVFEVILSTVCLLASEREKSIKVTSSFLQIGAQTTAFFLLSVGPSSLTPTVANLWKHFSDGSCSIFFFLLSLFCHSLFPGTPSVVL